jgi:hypothetical protein
VREKNVAMRSPGLKSSNPDARLAAMVSLKHTTDDVSATGIILIIIHILKNLGMQLLCY